MFQILRNTTTNMISLIDTIFKNESVASIPIVFKNGKEETESVNYEYYPYLWKLHKNK